MFQFHATRMYYLSNQQRKCPLLPVWSLWERIATLNAFIYSVTQAFGFGSLSQVGTKETGSVSLGSRLINWLMVHLRFWNLMPKAQSPTQSEKKKKKKSCRKRLRIRTVTANTEQFLLKEFINSLFTYQRTILLLHFTVGATVAQKGHLPKVAQLSGRV